MRNTLFSLVNKLGLTFSLLLFCLSSYSTNYSWTGAVNSNWGMPGNWSPVGVPQAADNVTINAATRNAPVVNTNVNIVALTVTGARLTINPGFSLTTAGVTVITGSNTLIDGAGILNIGKGKTPVPMVTIGSPVSGLVINTEITIQASSTSIQNTIFNGAVTLRHNNTASNVSAANGGNTFNGATTIELLGIGGLVLTNIGPDSFRDLTLNCSSAGGIYLGTAFPAVINGNVTLSSSAGGSIVFSNNAGGTTTLQENKTITTNSFTSGTIVFKNFTQKGNTSQSLTVNGNSRLSFVSGNVFEGAVTVQAPTVNISGTTFRNSVFFTKNGASQDFSTGGNRFEGTATFNVSAGTLYMQCTNNDGSGGIEDFFGKDVNFLASATGNFSLNKATFNGEFRVYNTSPNQVFCSNNGATVYNGNVTAGSSNGNIYFGYNGGG